MSGSGSLVQSGPGTLRLAGTVSGFTGAYLLSGGTLELTNPSSLASSSTVQFASGSTATLQVDGAITTPAVISGLNTGDVIDLAGLTFNGNTTPVVSGSQVSVTEGTTTEVLTIAGAAFTSFTLASDGRSGTVLTGSSAQPVVSSGATLVVSSGVTSANVVVRPGGTLDVLRGGTAQFTAVSGIEIVLGTEASGGVASGGVQTVSSGGLVSGDAVSSGGAQTVLGGGIVRGGSVTSGASETVSSGGVASGVTVVGSQTVLAGGSASGTVVSANFFATGELVSGGIVTGTQLQGGEVIVEGAGAVGGSAVGTILSGFESFLYVYSGGVTTGTVISGPINEENVYASGSALGTTVSSGSLQIVAGGFTSGTVLVGGSQSITSGVALNDVVSSGATVTDNATLAFTESAGSTTIVSGTLSGSGSLVQSGPGTLKLAGTASGFTGGYLLSGGTLELTNPGSLASSSTVQFAAGSTATLQIDGTATTSAVISGLNTGDTIDLAGLTFSGSTTPVVSGSQVSVTEGTTTEVLTVAGASYTSFTLASDGHSGTLLTGSGTQPVVSSGATLVVSSGVTSANVLVRTGGTLDVLKGGTAQSTMLAGTEIVLGTEASGGVASGGVQTVSSGGVVSGDTVSSGGAQTVLGGGIVRGGSVMSGASETVSSGGVASGVTVVGSQTVLAGGSASGTVVSANFFATGELVSGGVVTGTQLQGGDVLVEGAGAVSGSAVGTVVTGTEGIVYVYGGGVTTGTVLSGSYGEESVYGSGSALGTTVNSGNTQYLYGGFTSGTVLVGGSQSITSGVALNDVVSSRGTVTDNATLAFTEAAGSSTTFSGTLSGSGSLVQSGPGTLKLAGTVSGFTGGYLLSGGTLELTNPGNLTSSSTVQFASGSTATLQVDGAITTPAVISGLNAGDIIDLAGLSFVSSGGISVSGNSVTVSEGGASETLTIAGASFFPGFTDMADASGGTDLTIACYCTGTLIATPQGERPVESLAIGDTLVTASGAHRPIRWIGRRSYAGRFLAANPAVQPIRFRAGSLGGGLPHRDLLVSPEHAMFIDGVLVPARCLVNGVTIKQERDCKRVDYFHVELAAHDVIFAEGAPSETFVDDDSRGVFHNAAEWNGPSDGPARYYAPRVENGFALQAVRDRLSVLAEQAA